MRALPAFITALTFSLLMAAPSLAQADAAIVKLIFRGADGSDITLPIPVLVTGASTHVVVSPHAGQASARWQMRAGDTLSSVQRPAARELTLMTGGETLCIAQIRYLRAGKQWRPTLRLLPRAAPLRQGGKLTLLPLGTGHPDLEERPSGLPSAEGYYTSIEFSLPGHPLSVDAWQLR